DIRRTDAFPLRRASRGGKRLCGSLTLANNATDRRLSHGPRRPRAEPDRSQLVIVEAWRRGRFAAGFTWPRDNRRCWLDSSWDERIASGLLGGPRDRPGGRNLDYRTRSALRPCRLRGPGSGTVRHDVSPRSLRSPDSVSWNERFCERCGRIFQRKIPSLFLFHHFQLTGCRNG